MTPLMQLDLEGRNKIEAAIALIQSYANSDDPFYLAFSGGKDSFKTGQELWEHWISF